MTRVAQSETSVLIDGPVGPLELVIMSPKGTPRGLAVICHPHSLMGGSLGNKVVHTLARLHRDIGHVAVRFNFRGVGRSAGVYDGGIGERADLAAVVDWARVRVPEGPLCLAGFSFGAWVAAGAVAEDVPATAGLSPAHLLLVAPPVHHFDWQGVVRFACPLTVIMGDADEVVPPSSVEAWLATLLTPVSVGWLPGAGHFFHGRLTELGQAAGYVDTVSALG